MPAPALTTPLPVPVSPPSLPPPMLHNNFQQVEDNDAEPSNSVSPELPINIPTPTMNPVDGEVEGEEDEDDTNSTHLIFIAMLPSVAFNDPPPRTLNALTIIHPGCSVWPDWMIDAVVAMEPLVA